MRHLSVTFIVRSSGGSWHLTGMRQTWQAAPSWLASPLPFIPVFQRLVRHLLPMAQVLPAPVSLPLEGNDLAAVLVVAIRARGFETGK